MTTDLLPLLSGCILEEEAELTLSELCKACNVHAELIVELVEEGVLEPLGSDPTSWIFKGGSLKRIRVALHLQTDLGVNLAGAALALQLLDELDSLRTRLHIIEANSTDVAYH